MFQSARTRSTASSRVEHLQALRRHRPPRRLRNPSSDKSLRRIMRIVLESSTTSALLIFSILCRLEGVVAAAGRGRRAEARAPASIESEGELRDSSEAERPSRSAPGPPSWCRWRPAWYSSPQSRRRRYSWRFRSTPLAASATLRPISLVVTVCSSTAEAMLLEMSLIWLMMALISSMAVTAPLVSVWMASIFWLISSVALAVCLASSLTSLATTAKPLPASPARAASMVAFSASRLVCCAMEVMTLITLPISIAGFAQLGMVSLVALRHAHGVLGHLAPTRWRSWRSRGSRPASVRCRCDRRSRSWKPVRWPPKPHWPA